MNPPHARFDFAPVAVAFACFTALAACIATLSACSRAPAPTGVLVYSDAAGRVVAWDFDTKRSRTLVSGGAEGDLAVDRSGRSVVYAATGPEGVRALLSRNLVTGTVEALCQAGYPDVPTYWRGPAFSASGEEVVFTTRDATGDRAAHLAKGSRHCARVADGITSTEFGPGVDRVLLADERAFAAYAVTDPLVPAVPPGVSLPPVWRSDEAIVDLAVDRLYERFAVLTPSRFLARGFSGGTTESAFEFAKSNEGDAGRDPVSLSFSPDGGFIAVVFGPRDGAHIRIYEIPRPGATFVDRGEVPLDPAPIPAQFAWVPRLLGTGEPAAP
ncbi:MAG: hypothetical protein IT350_18445 [Deltaproteobacteria bacterium]|nr:hypothetical protein [Deltaproteobacteria bacterium]